MKKKYYFPDRLFVILTCVVLLILGLLPLYVTAQVIIYIFENEGQLGTEEFLIRIAIGIIFILPAILLGYNISNYLCYTIVLDKEKIYIHEDTNPKKRKIQYYTSVNYCDVKSINIIWSNRKSNGEESGIDSITGGGVKIPYLRIETINGER